MVPAETELVRLLYRRARRLRLEPQRDHVHAGRVLSRRSSPPRACRTRSRATQRASSAASPTARTISSTASWSASTPTSRSPTSSRRRPSAAPSAASRSRTNSSQKLAWFSTTRVRGGFLLGDNILLYATGGLANGRIEASSSNTVTVAGGCLIPGGCPTGGISQEQVGLGGRRRHRSRERPVAVPRRVSALRSRHASATSSATWWCRLRRSAHRPQGLRRHGARRHHLSLQLDAARPDLRHRPDLIFSNTRREKEQPARRAGCSAFSDIGYRQFSTSGRWRGGTEPVPGCVLRSAAGCACA